MSHDHRSDPYEALGRAPTTQNDMEILNLDGICNQLSYAMMMAAERGDTEAEERISKSLDKKEKELRKLRGWDDE